MHVGKPSTPTFSQLECEPITGESTNFIIVVQDDTSHPLPSATVTARSTVNETLIWQGYTRTTGTILQTISVRDVQVSVELEGFFKTESDAS